MCNTKPVMLGVLELPSVFPKAEFDHINLKASKYASSNQAKWMAFSGAWNALPFRWKAVHEHKTSFIKSISISSAPPMNERYRQDHDLFVFVVSGLSAIECFFFASYSMASMTNAAKFPLSQDNDLKVYPLQILRLFQIAYSSNQLTKSMDSILSAQEWKTLSDVRNVLAHRGTPPRAHSLSNVLDHESKIPDNLKQLASGWQYNFRLDRNCLDAYISFIDTSLKRLIVDADKFASQHL